MVNPDGKMLSRGVNLITLSAGEHSVNVSELVEKIVNVLRHIETHLTALSLTDAQATQSGSDILVSVEFHFGAQ